MDDATGQIASPDAEDVEVYGGVGQRLERCSLPERAVRPMFVVVDLVLSQRSQEMPLIPDRGAAEQLLSASADPPLHDRVGVRRQLRLMAMIGTGVCG